MSWIYNQRIKILIIYTLSSLFILRGYWIKTYRPNWSVIIQHGGVFIFWSGLPGVLKCFTSRISKLNWARRRRPSRMPLTNTGSRCIYIQVSLFRYHLFTHLWGSCGIWVNNSYLMLNTNLRTHNRTLARLQWVVPLPFLIFPSRTMLLNRLSIIWINTYFHTPIDHLGNVGPEFGRKLGVYKYSV